MNILDRISAFRFEQRLSQGDLDLARAKRHLEHSKSIQVNAVFELISPDYSKVWGFDCSHWNGRVDMQKAKQNGANFVFIKGMDGTVPTRWFPENYAAAKAAGILRGVYCWLYPSSRVSVNAQAEAWWNLVKDDYPDLPLVIDFEWTYYNGEPANPTPNDLSAAIDRFSALSGKSPLVYTSYGFVRTVGYISTAITQKTRGVWCAHYGVEQPLIPPDYGKWHFWQASDQMDGEIVGYDPGISKAADLNYWHSDKASLIEFAGGDPQTEPPPDEEWDATTLMSLGIYKTPDYCNPNVMGRIAKGKTKRVRLQYNQDETVLFGRFQNKKGKDRFLPIRERDLSRKYASVIQVVPEQPLPDNEFVVPSDGFFGQGLHDYQTEEWSYKSRVIKLNFKKGALPETIPLTSHPEFIPMNRAWQEFIFECLKRASKNTLSHNELLVAWASLTADGRSHFDDHAVQNGFTDHIRGINLGSPKGDIQIKCLGVGGNLYKLAQPGFYGTRYLIETLNGSLAPPPIDEVWGKQWLIQWATESTPDRLPDGSWVCGRFPQLKPFGTPIPLVSPQGTCYIDKGRIQRIEPGTTYSPYNPSNA